MTDSVKDLTWKEITQAIEYKLRDLSNRLSSANVSQVVLRMEARGNPFKSLSVRFVIHNNKYDDERVTTSGHDMSKIVDEFVRRHYWDHENNCPLLVHRIPDFSDDEIIRSGHSDEDEIDF